MHSIKTPTSIVAIDEPIKLLTQAEYDAIKNKSDRVYFITDNARKNVIGIIKSGVELNNFSASKIQVTPSGNITKTNAQEAIIENDTHIKDTNITLNSHKSNTSNPHKVTKSQIGLGNVNNTSDVNKPVSTAQKKAIDAVNTSLTTHTSDTFNPHNVTKSQVGLGNVDNTSDINKPVSTAQQSAINDAKKSVSNSLNSHTSNTSNPHKVTKSQVGLGNVDNTSDINKPVSTAQKKAIDAVNTSLTTHTSNTTAHITAAERNAWNSKAAGDHIHDDRYYTESEINNKLSGKADSDHTHDDRYYTESEINNKLSDKADSDHTHSTASESSAGLMSAADKSTLDILEYRTQTVYTSIGGNSSGEIGFLMPRKSGASRFIVNVLFLNGDYNSYLTWYQVRVSSDYVYVCCRNYGAGTWSGRAKALCIYAPDSHVTNRDDNNW